MRICKSPASILGIALLSCFCIAGSVFAEGTAKTIDQFFSTINAEDDANKSDGTSSFDEASGSVYSLQINGAEILKRKIIIEKRDIDEAKKRWRLSSDYCIYEVDNYENYKHCIVELERQNQECSGQVTSGRHVYVDLENQLLYAVKDCRLVAYSRTITGKNTTPSPVGNFKIYIRRGPHWMQGEWYVTKAFYFYKGAALHDAGWRQGINWLPERRAYYGSHGCINLPTETMEILWEEYSLGDPVHVWRQLPEDIAAELQQKTTGLDFVDPVRDLEIANR